jgi:hypothetical protein
MTHIVAVKFLKCHYCSNTVKSLFLWMNVTRYNIYLYDVQVSTCLVDAYGEHSCLCEVTFLSCLRFQNVIESNDEVMCKKQNKKTPWPLVRKRTIPTERPPLVDEI